MNEFNVKVFLDGSQWCALVGENIQEGTAGFGSDPVSAFHDLVDTLSNEGAL